MRLERWLAVGLLGMALAQGGAGGWQTLAPLPEARQEVAAAELGGLIYVAGGFLASGRTSDRVEAFNPARNEWRALPPLPVGVNHPAAVGLGGKVYVLGGYQGPSGLAGPSAAVQVYDPAADRWSQAPALPTPRGGLTAVVLDGRIYAIGGANRGSVGDLAVYDPAADRWTALAPMPTPRDHTGAGVIGGKIYVAGGRNQRSFTLDTLEAYDPKTNQWQSLPPMPTGRSGHAVAALGECLYSFGGEGNRRDPAGMFAQVEVFSAAAGRWAGLADMPTPRHGVAAVTLNGRVYLPAGATQLGMGAVTTNESFTPPPCPR